MTEVAGIDFGEGRQGVVPVGTYLGDAARRMGVMTDPCEPGLHHCAFLVENGQEFLSKLTTDEEELLIQLDLDAKNRLGCFAQIQKPGVIVVMARKESEVKDEPKKSDDRDETYRKDFVEMPLEKKIANLIQLEMITISETLAYVVNSPFTIFDKIGDVLAEFGFKKEEAEKQAARPQKSSHGEKSKGPRPSRKGPSTAEAQ